MNKIPALTISLLITIIVAGNWLFFTNIFVEREQVVIVEVKDGDTVVLQDGRTVRLLNINTIERGHPGSDEATSYLQEYINKTLGFESEGLGRYGRVLGRFYLEEKYINLEIVRQGLAHSYLVDSEETGLFREAENSARSQEIGIWELSLNQGCLSAEINKKDEFVSFINGCGESLAGWELKDETAQSLKFPDLNYPEQFIIYSSSGENVPGKIYWGRGKAWNDDKDAIFIRDEAGKLVYFDRYGYE